MWFRSKKSAGDLESLCPDDKAAVNGSLTFVNNGIVEEPDNPPGHQPGASNGIVTTTSNGNSHPLPITGKQPGGKDNQPSERILKRLWRCGHWQLLVFNYIGFIFMMQACWPIISHNFIAAEIGFHCRPDPVMGNLSGEAVNVSYVTSTTCPAGPSHAGNSSDTSEAPSPCPFGYAFMPSPAFVRTSIVSEWNLVCSKGHLAEASHTIFMAGILVGGAILPPLADHFGRKRIHIICQLIGAAFGLGIAAVPTFSQFASLKFFIGVMREGVLITGIIWCLEFIPSRYRSICGIGFELYWCFHWCVITLLAYLIRDWRLLQVALSLPFLLAASLVWVAPESPTWLIAKKKYVELGKIILHQANRVNRVTFPESILNAMQPGTTPPNNNTSSLDSQDKYLTILDIPRSRRLLIWTGVLNLLWFQNVVGYYGITFLSTFQAGNKYFNFLLNGLVEVPAYLFGMIVLHKMGRRWPLFVHQMLTGVTLLLSGFIPSTYYKVEKCFLLLAKYSLTFCFGTLIVYTPEIYPTTLRGAGVGINSVMGRLAGLLVPYSSVVYQIYPWLPAVCFGLLSILAGICGWIVLPETKGRAMPETLEQLDAWERGSLYPCEAKSVDPPTGNAFTGASDPLESHI